MDQCGSPSSPSSGGYSVSSSRGHFPTSGHCEHRRYEKSGRSAAGLLPSMPEPFQRSLSTTSPPRSASRLEMRFGQAVWVRRCPHGNGLKFRPSGGWTTTTTTTLAGMGTPVAEPHFLHPMAMLGYGLSWSSERKSPPIDSGNSLTTPSMREGSTSSPTKMQPVLAAATAMLLRPLSMGSHTT